MVDSFSNWRRINPTRAASQPLTTKENMNMTTITTRAQAFTAENVIKFHGHDVENGEVNVSNEAYVDFLNEIYGDVQVCGNTYGSGDLLEAQDPVAFRCGKSDWESELQAEMEELLESEDTSFMEFEVSPDDISDEDE